MDTQLPEIMGCSKVSPFKYMLCLGMLGGYILSTSFVFVESQVGVCSCPWQTKSGEQSPTRNTEITSNNTLFFASYSLHQLVQQKPAILKGSTTKWHFPPTCWVKMEISGQSQFWWAHFEHNVGPLVDFHLTFWATSRHLEFTAAFVVYNDTIIPKSLLIVFPKNRWCMTNIKHLNKLSPSTHHMTLVAPPPRCWDPDDFQLVN